MSSFYMKNKVILGENIIYSSRLVEFKSMEYEHY